VRVLLSGHSAILATDEGKPLQVITRSDLIAHGRRVDA
jgi:predicted transcriptional regulator